MDENPNEPAMIANILESAPVDMGPIEATVAILSSQAIRFGDVGALKIAIVEIYGTFVSLGQPAVVDQPVEPQKEPAVPIKKSVAPDYLICLEDGKKFKSLKRHLSSHYGMTPDEYREKWGLPKDYPMVAPNYSATRSQLAKNSGLGKKAK